MQFAGKIALVTGGSQGIGARIAEKLALEGASVMIVASGDITKANAMADRIKAAGGQAQGFVADVREPRQVKLLVDQILEQVGRIDLLVNCAGVFFPTPIGETSADDVNRIVDINLKGVFNSLNAVIPAMKRQGEGRIVSISSVAALLGVSGYSLYCGTKAAVAMMTKCLALELAPLGIRINAIAPGNTATPMNENIRTDPQFAPMLEAMTAKTPSGRTFSDPDDIADLALYLLSDKARAMHGALVVIDEGISAGL